MAKKQKTRKPPPPPTGTYIAVSEKKWDDAIKRLAKHTNDVRSWDVPVDLFKKLDYGDVLESSGDIKG